MNSKWLTLRVIVTAMSVVAQIAFLVGCAATQPTQTGFLTHYEDIAPRQSGESDPAFRKTGSWETNYTGFIVEPVVFRRDAAMPDLDAETVQTLTADYQAKLVEAFAVRFKPVTSPGPGVLRIRAAITAAERANPVVNVVTMAAVFVPVTTGGASTEAEVLDSVTGERLAALTAFNNGGRSVLGGPVGFLSQYGHARRAFTVQAGKLKDLVGADS